MKFHFQQAFRAAILLAFAGYIIQLHVTGDILKLVNPKYLLLSQSAAVLFIFLFLIQIFRVWSNGDEHEHDENCTHDGCSHDDGYSKFSIRRLLSYSILCFPLLTGFLLPPKTLDASIAAKKGTMLPQESQIQQEENSKDISIQGNEGNNNQDQTGNIEHNELSVGSPVIMDEKEYDDMMSKLEDDSIIKMTNDSFNAYYEALSMEPFKYKDRQITMTGFVYKEEGFESNQLVISRFLITHCVADASVVGFLSEFDEAPSILVDEWVEVKGTLDVIEYNGVELPMLKINALKKVKEPKEPYVYPVYTKIE